MVTNSPIVQCNVWCVDNDEKQIEMGFPEGDRWMPIAIDFSQIRHIKLAGENEFLGNDKACLGFDSGTMTVDITYDDAVKIWLNIMQKQQHFEWPSPKIESPNFDL